MAHIEIRNVPEALHQVVIEAAAALTGRPEMSGHSVAVHSDSGAQIYGIVKDAGAVAPEAPAS